MKCGKPYCACVGQCFAESSPLNDNGAIMTDDATYRNMKQERDLALSECEIAINPHASYLGDEVIDIIKELK